jgi:hypothetical protein
VSSVPEQADAASPLAAGVGLALELALGATLGLGSGVGDAAGEGETAGVGLAPGAPLELELGLGLTAGEPLPDGDAEVAAPDGLELAATEGEAASPSPVRAVNPAYISRTTKTAARTIEIPIQRAASSAGEGDWRVMSEPV